MNNTQLKTSEEKFLAYEEVRESGFTNMFDRRAVIRLADQMCGVTLTPDDVMDIMQNYSEYSNMYL